MKCPNCSSENTERYYDHTFDEETLDCKDCYYNEPLSVVKTESTGGENQ